MESGKRSSFDEISIAALRRFTRTPTSHRLSLRRSTSGSTSSASIKSFESEKRSSCIDESTCGASSEKCAIHRFIVWTAVKRNACPNITAEQRRQCPLKECGQQFPTHELLFYHISQCDQLINSGEYWCYDCGKFETLQAGGRRRRSQHVHGPKKLMNMAKSMFSSLGRPKPPSAPAMDSHRDDGSPACDDSDQERTQHFVELQSNEIHEIDSSEVMLPPIPEDGETFQPDYLSRSSSTSSTSTTYTRCLSMSSQQPMSKTSAPMSYGSYIKWSPSLPVQTVSPADLVNSDPAAAAEAMTISKPTLHINTTAAFDYYRARTRRRSKNLQPSSSVRSTSSTTSTTSTASTDSTSSTASCTVSPMSTWSGAWANSRGFESTLTSPADDVPNPDDVFPCSQPLQSHPEVSDIDLTFSHFVNGPTGFIGLSELPAEVPMTFDPVDIIQAIVPPPDVTSLSAETLPPESLDGQTKLSQKLVDDIKRVDQRQASTYTLIHSARDTLSLHVSGSLEKLEPLCHDRKNHVATHFRQVPANSVAMLGLESMLEVLQGRQVHCPTRLLSFLHVVYSLSLVIHEQNVTNRWTDFFVQAISYCSWIPQGDRLAYLQVVDFLWKPDSVTDQDFMDLLQRSLSHPSSASGNGKGKEVASPVDFSNDPLIFISQYFLDELEYAALRNTTKPHIQTINICTQHMNDANLLTAPNSPFADATNLLISFLSQQYPDAPGLLSSLEDLQRRIATNHVSTVRRLELELLQSGKMQLPLDVYFGLYVKQVRTYIDSIHAHNSLSFPTRMHYHKLGIELMASTMQDGGGNLLELGLGESHPAVLHPDISGLMQLEPNISLDDYFSFDTGLPIDQDSSDSRTDDSTPQEIQPSQNSSSTSKENLSKLADSGSPSICRELEGAALSTKVNSDTCCEICGYRPKGDPKWFHGSMAKHRKLQHANSPPKIYPCPFPGCNSQYKNRPDNLRQHQIEKGHFVDGQDKPMRGRKRRKLEQD